MKKRLFSLFTSLVMVISLVGVMPTMSVGALTSGDYEYSVFSNGTVKITDYNGSATNLTIPSTINGKKVTSIGDYAFYYCNRLTSITIPDSVTSIGNYAFDSCVSLTSVTIGNSVTSIGNYAFSDCDSLTSVTIGNSVTSIGKSAFAWCISLTSITIPDSVTSIGDYAFRSCDSLTSITIPDSVTSIGSYAFAYCESLTSINVNANNKYYSSVDGVLFNKNKTELIQYPIGNKRNSYTIPDSVTSIGYDAFALCNSLTSVTIPDSVTSIGDWAFAWCDSLTSATIPDSVTSIGVLAFYSCDSLTSITIGNGVTSIGEGAFEACRNLANITIPDSVTSIGNNAFYDCDNLTIKCYTNSTAHQYAKNNGIKYKLLSSISVSKPTTFKMALNSSSSVRLSWNKVSGANGYILEQYKSGKWTRVAKITNPSTVQYSVKGLASGTTYKFRMKAYKMSGGKAYYSGYTSTLTVCTKPATVKFTLTPGSKKATVKWSKVTGASGYIVYYRTSPSKGWTRLKKVGSSTTSFTKTGLTKGKTYYFTVRSYKISNNKVYYGGFTSKSVKVK